MTAKRPRERDSDLLLVRTLDQEDCSPITNDLATFLHPISVKEFRDSVYQKKAFVVKVHPKLRQRRLQHISEVLHNFNPVRMLAESNSEKIMVWMGTDKTLHSVKVTPEEAKGCYDAGCGLYFRASEDLESEIVPAFSEALGHSFASFFRDGQRRGEIETFVTHVGHVTNWHTDFQENFTVQLRGAKRWYLRQGPVEHPHRAYAPHFRDVKVLHTQTQIMRAGNASFVGLPQDLDGTCESIVLQPGDVLYHPAGIYHKVETIAIGDDHTNSLSINVSLFPQTWAEFIAESAQQISLTHPSLREAVRFDNVEEGRVLLKQRIETLGRALSTVKPAMLLPAALSQPIGLVTVTAKGVEREDGKVVKDESALKGPWKKSPMGVLSVTPDAIAIPLMQRPAKATGDDDSESESDDDDGSIEVPPGAVRFDYHSNFIAMEANIGLPPALHCVFVAKGDSAQSTLTRLAGLASGADVTREAVSKIPGLLTVLLDVGFMA